jgi:hypothetical protein
MSTSPKEWANIFKRYNSGTYNNQWIVLDTKAAALSLAGMLPEGTLWILEQIPTFIEAADMTDHLNKFGYWPSYNVPYFTVCYFLLVFNLT